MKIRIMALILCAGFLLFAVSGCSLKAPKSSDASPDASASGDSSAPDTDSSAVSTITGVVTEVGGASITLDLVTPADTSANGDTATGDDSAAMPDTDPVVVGGVSYSLTGGSETITVPGSATIMLGTEGYNTGTLDDIEAGDFVAIAYNGGGAVTVVDSGPSGSGGDTGTEPVQPDTNTQPESNDGGDISVGVPDNSTSATYVVDTDDLNVRSGPGASETSLGKLAKGTKVTGTVKDGWLKFTYKGKTAYCSSQYLAVSTSSGGSDTGTDTGTPDSGTKATYVVNTDDLKIRGGPGMSESVLGKLAKGTKVTGTVKDGWLKFSLNGKTVYCSADYLDAGTADSTAAGVPDSATEAMYTVATDSLNVRSGPGTSDTVLGKLDTGAKVTGTVADGWLKFSYKGQTAYCKAEFLIAG
jgi:uncharacterized protein YgiM (DUF1202 family)